MTRPSAIQVALATLLPFGLGLYAARTTLLVAEHYGGTTISFVLVGWCALMGVSAAWLNHALFDFRKTLVPFHGAIAVTLAVWLWQRLAFTILVPQSNLTYGYFKTPAGAKAGFWVLTFPFWLGTAALCTCLAIVLLWGWRMGRRTLLFCVVPWWLASFLIFALPSMYLDAQGNASIFI